MGLSFEYVVEGQVFENEELQKTELDKLASHLTFLFDQCSTMMVTWSACYPASVGTWNENLERTLLCPCCSHGMHPAYRPPLPEHLAMLKKF